MPGGKLQHQKPSPKSKDFADKQRSTHARGHFGGGVEQSVESGQGTDRRGPAGQFTGAGEPGLQKK